MTPRPIDRRTFLISLGAVGLAAACTDGSSETAPTAAEPASSGEPTTESPTTVPSSTVAPTPDPVTPLEAPPVDLPDGVFAFGVASGDPDHQSLVVWTRFDVDPETGAIPVVWEVATDPTFAAVVATELVDTSAVEGFTVHGVASGLEPRTSYWYRFRSGAMTSPVGRTRTLPGADDTEPVHLGVSSCQRADDGTYRAHADLADAELDAVVWLGDYIYGSATSLDEYRALYADYRRDPDLQASHAAHPWIVIADDHEVANDYDATIDPARRAAAFRAWWENQPTRLPAPDPEPGGAPAVVYRSVDVGALARLVLTDVRQYATPTSLHGGEQLAWLETSLDHEQRWTVLASPVLASGLAIGGSGDDGEPLLPYTLDAHPEERRTIASWLATAPSPLIVSGDLHAGMVLDFSADPADPAAPVVATEFMAPAISSQFPADLAGFAPLLPLLNPHIEHVDVANGWLDLRLERDEAIATYRTVRDVDDSTSRVDQREFRRQRRRSGSS